MRRRGPREALADQQGLTLAEVLVALAVIGIGLVGVAVVVPVSSYALQEGGQLSTATFLAEQLIERARSAMWSADPAVDCLGLSIGDTPPQPVEGTCHGSTTTGFPDEPAVEAHPGYQRTVRVTDCEAPPGCAGVSGAGMRRVTVTVRYTPLTASGVTTGPRAIRLDWLASRQ